MQPTITKMRSNAMDHPRYRIEGGDISPAWASAVQITGRLAWCEFTLAPDGTLGSYGGEVWPTAWPDLFETTGTPEFPNGTAQFPAGLRLTAAGHRAVAVAT